MRLGREAGAAEVAHRGVCAEPIHLFEDRLHRAVGLGAPQRHREADVRERAAVAHATAVDLAPPAARDHVRERLGAGRVAQHAEDQRVGLPLSQGSCGGEDRAPGLGEREARAAQSVADRGHRRGEDGIVHLSVLRPGKHLRAEDPLLHQLALQRLDVDAAEVAAGLQGPSRGEAERIALVLDVGAHSRHRHHVSRHALAHAHHGDGAKPPGQVGAQGDVGGEGVVAGVFLGLGHVAVFVLEEAVRVLVAEGLHHGVVEGAGAVDVPSLQAVVGHDAAALARRRPTGPRRRGRLRG